MKLTNDWSESSDRVENDNWEPWKTRQKLNEKLIGLQGTSSKFQMRNKWLKIFFWNSKILLKKFTYCSAERYLLGNSWILKQNGVQNDVQGMRTVFKVRIDRIFLPFNKSRRRFLIFILLKKLPNNDGRFKWQIMHPQWSRPIHLLVKSSFKLSILNN